MWADIPHQRDRDRYPTQLHNIRILLVHVMSDARGGPVRKDRGGWAGKFKM